MLRVIVLLLGLSFSDGISWHTDLKEAEQTAHQQHKHILLNFSGSDWCGPCIRMHNEIFGNALFAGVADSQLVMVNADFPRMKRNQLSAHQQDLNNKMADQYNSQGKFPLTLLLTADGKVLKSWDGLPDMKADAFAAEVRRVIETDSGH